MKIRVNILFATLLVFGVASATAGPPHLHKIYIHGTHRDCNVQECAVALGPGAVACTATLASGGGNVFADEECVSKVLENVVNVPESCAGCASAAKEFLQEAEVKVGNWLDTAKGKLGKLFGGVF
ncbi:hypothetical protein M422DRAFT_239889 [Sphaerobolus stellatus SS14]|nr:hypothetical protein M422DRAFT_239889 [Sphaerobolus stellatus SS14]